MTQIAVHYESSAKLQGVFIKRFLLAVSTFKRHETYGNSEETALLLNFKCYSIKFKQIYAFVQICNSFEQFYHSIMP